MGKSRAQDPLVTQEHLKNTSKNTSKTKSNNIHYHHVLRAAKEPRQVLLDHVRRVLQVFVHMLLGELHHAVGVEEIGVHVHDLGDHHGAEPVAQARRGDAPFALLGQQRVQARVEGLCEEIET